MKQRLLKRAASVMTGAFLLTAFATQGGHAAVFSANDTPPPITHVTSILTHTPSGTTRLTWDAKSSNLTVQMTLYGLVPDSVHPAHIHQGADCASNGDTLYELNDVVADATGAANVTTVIPGVTDGIPAQDWYINVHNGPTLDDDDQAKSIACTEVENLNQSNALSLHMYPTADANQAAYGLASLDVIDGKLIVNIEMNNLEPDSEHPVEIHLGTCQRETYGQVFADLNPLEADANGQATSTTILDEVTGIHQDGSWYLSVHDGTDLSTQTGADQIACGNIKT